MAFLHKNKLYWVLESKLFINRPKLPEMLKHLFIVATFISWKKIFVHKISIFYDITVSNLYFMVKLLKVPTTYSYQISWFNTALVCNIGESRLIQKCSIWSRFSENCFLINILILFFKPLIIIVCNVCWELQNSFFVLN